MDEGGDERPIPARGVLPEYTKIQNNFTFLVSILSSRPNDILDSMFAKNVIDDEDVEQIKKHEKHGSKTVAREILNVLLRCGPGSYRKFIECLRENKFIQALQKIEPGSTLSLSSTRTKPNRLCYQKLPNGLYIAVYAGDLLDVPADVLVCSNYGSGKAEGEIAQRIRERGGSGYKTSLDELYKRETTLSDWKVYGTLGGTLPFKCVYQAKVQPSLSGGITAWTSKLKKLYYRILKKASSEEYGTITLPVIGADFASGPTDQCIQIAMDALLEHKVKHLKQVNIVSNEDSSLKKLRDDLQSYRKASGSYSGVSASAPQSKKSSVSAEDVADFMEGFGIGFSKMIDMDTVKKSVNDMLPIPILKTSNRKNANRDRAGGRSSEAIYSEIRHHRRSTSNQGTPHQMKLKNGVVVFVYQEDVVDIHANILVCYKYGTSNFEGRIGKRLREEGGDIYADSLDELLRKRGGLKEWRMYPVKPGYLQFSEVYRAIIPSNPGADIIDDWLSSLQHLYQFILSTADEKRYKSITFPVANTGPIDKCIEVLVSSIKSHEFLNLRQVNIVTTADKSIRLLRRCLSTASSPRSTTSKRSESDESSTDEEVDETNDLVYKTKDAVVDETKEGEVLESSTAALSYPPQKLSNGLIVHLRYDDVVDVHSDVIITSNYGKAQTEGIIAKRLRAKGGVEYVKSLESLVRDNDGFEDWQVYSSKPGDLQFSEVYQAIIPPNPSTDTMDDWLSNLHGLYVQILATADAQEYTSITLPVLGSGETGAPPAKCTEVLKRVLEEYVAEKLLNVYIVTKDDFIFTLLMSTW